MVQESEAALLSSVFGWMTMGLITSGIVGGLVLNSGLVSTLTPGTLIVLFLVELGLVFG